MESDIRRLSSGGLHTICSINVERQATIYIELENAELGRLHSEVDGRGTNMKPEWIYIADDRL